MWNWQYFCILVQFTIELFSHRVVFMGRFLTSNFTYVMNMRLFKYILYVVKYEFKFPNIKMFLNISKVFLKKIYMYIWEIGRRKREK